MKYVIASDIHGSAYYTNELLKAYEAEAANRLILLGDILYHGPRNPLPREYDPQRVCTMLNLYKDQILCIRGNCDSEVDQMVLEFPILAEHIWLDLGETTAFLSHGHVYNLENPPLVAKGTILMNGHFHIPSCINQGGLTYMNPGSISLPKENSEHSYMVYENREFLWKNLQGEVFKRHII